MLNFNFVDIFSLFFLIITLSLIFYFYYVTSIVIKSFFLILFFITLSFYAVLMNMELSAIMFIIIYVGAIAVLIMFVIMMVPSINPSKVENYYNLFLLLVIVLVFFYFTYYCIYFNYIVNLKNLNMYVNNLYTFKNDLFYKLFLNSNQIIKIAYKLYQEFFLVVIFVGLLLLLGLVGVIIGSLGTKTYIRRQHEYNQLQRSNKIRLMDDSKR